MSGVTEKIRDRSSLLRLKSESPKFRDVMRQRCHQRWRENRWKFIEDRRKLSEEPDIKGTLCNLIKEDLKAVFLSHMDSDIDSKLKQMEEIENERISSELEWLMAQYDEILEDENRLNDMLIELNHIICPLCQKNELNLHTVDAEEYLTCKCGLSIKTTLSLLQIKDIITRCVDSHNNICNSDPQFTVIDENCDKHLFLCCYDCSNITMML